MRTKAEIDNNEWFGEMPDSWRMVPLPRLFMSSKGMTVTRADLVDEGAPVVNYAQVHSKLNNRFGIHAELIKHVPTGMVPKGLKYSEKGSFIFACTSEDLAGCGDCIYNDSEQPVNPGGDTLLLSPVDGIENKYLAYLFSTDMWRWQIRRDLVDVKVFHVNQGNLHETYVTVPPYDVQRRIISYLDERCAAIDEDVAKRREVIGKLKEYKKSLTAHAVTKGLDPSAEMRDSGVEWIGEIPVSWIIAKAKSCLSFSNARNSGNQEAQVLSLYREYGVIPKSSRDDNHNRTSEDTSDYKNVRPGDLVINKMKAWQGSLGLSEYEGIVSPAYFVYRVNQRSIEGRYLHYLVRSIPYAQRWNALSYGIREGQWDLHREDFESDYLIFPPLLEQRRIVSYLDERCADIDEAISRQEQLIEKLGEYRKSVIHHAVTGKIDCTEA